MDYKIIFGLLILGLVILSGCTQQSTQTYVCSDGSVVSNLENCSIAECPELNCSECGFECSEAGECPECLYNEETCSTFEIETIRYVCPDGETIVDDINDCSDEEVGTGETEGEQNEPKYIFYNVGQSISKSLYESSEAADWGPLKVKLIKVGKKIYEDHMKLKVYWEIENLHGASLAIYPHEDTYVSLGGSEYYYADTSNMEGEDDDFSIGSKTGGNLKSGEVASGAVIIDNIPLLELYDEGIVTIGLDVLLIGEFEFNVDIYRPETSLE